MAIRFNGLYIPALHGPILDSGPVSMCQNTHYAGVNGVSQIILGTGDSQLQTWLMLCKKADGQFDTAVSVAQWVKKLQSLINTNGTLDISGGIAEQYYNCTLISVPRSRDILKDDAGTLGGGYWTMIEPIVWQCLTPVKG